MTYSVNFDKSEDYQDWVVQQERKLQILCYRICYKNKTYFQKYKLSQNKKD
jgi:hypothetical protein